MTWNSTFKTKNDKPMLRTQFGRTRMKKKICKICKEDFETSQPLAIVCSPTCAIEHAKSQRETAQKRFAKLDRADTKKRKEALKSRSDYIKEAQIAFNAFIRFRDRDTVCICCGLPLEKNAIGGGFDCGHYRSVGSAPHLRFHPDNAHGQRKQCNRYGAGRAVDYRIGLIRRIGLEAVETLESNNKVIKWTIDDLKSIKAEYKDKLKELQNGLKNTNDG